jgi:hypothetical protein
MQNKENQGGLSLIFNESTHLNRDHLQILRSSNRKIQEKQEGWNSQTKKV